MTRICCISDTHTKHDKIVVPDCDILIHAGDATFNGDGDEVMKFMTWLSWQPAKHKIFIAGNHDWNWVHANTAWRDCAKAMGLVYLQDSSVTIDGLKFYGSPWQPEFCNWAFNLPRGPQLAEKWAQIPDDTDVLITHGPPYGINDTVPGRSERLGCRDLRNRVSQLDKLKLHVYGHIHGSGGKVFTGKHKSVNASVCDELYKPSNTVMVIDI